MESKKIITTGLDFDVIKANLKTFLRGQSKFSDYDFDGAAFNIMLDVLAYNTHYMSLYNNLALNESFLDSASKRASVVSIAKELGYVPRGSRASTAVVDVEFNIPDNTDESILLAPNTPFNTAVGPDGKTFTFVTIDSSIAYNSNGVFTFKDVHIKEGTFIDNRFIADDSISYVLENLNIDSSTIKVRVFESMQSSVFSNYVSAENIISLNSDSEVYFIKETQEGFVELQFGDGVLGKALSPGNMLVVTYIVCNNAEPNGARTFTYNGPSLGGSTALPTVTTVQRAVNGSAPEDIESVRWNAPRRYATQNRCVTVEDYTSVIQANFPSAQAINVWGGEDNDPPSYSDVYISIKPSTGEVLTDVEKNYILTEVLGPRKLITMHPKFVDPEFLYINLDITYYYNPRATPLLPKEMSQVIYNQIVNYNDTSLSRFDSVFRYSYVASLIDKSNRAITSNITTVSLEKEVFPSYNQTTEYTVKIGNPIYNSGLPEESIVSTGFYTINVPQMCFIQDIPTEGSDIGLLQLFYYNGGNKTKLKNIGTVNYALGTLYIDPITITGVDGDSLRFKVKPQSNNVASSRNQIVMIVPDNITINSIIEPEANRYKFVSSRT